MYVHSNKSKGTICTMYRPDEEVCMLHDRQAKAKIYTQNSFFFFQRKNCPGWDLNPRHSAFYVSALPTELPAGQLSWLSANPDIQGRAITLTQYVYTCKTKER